MVTAKKNKVSGDRVYLWKFQGEEIIVPGSEIIYLHTEQRKVYLHTVKGVYRIGGSLKAAVKDVEDLPMVKTHSSYLVHLEYLESVNRHDAVLKNGEHVPVSSRCWTRLKPVLEAYVKGKSRKNTLT